MNEPETAKQLLEGKMTLQDTHTLLDKWVPILKKFPVGNQEFLDWNTPSDELYNDLKPYFNIDHYGIKRFLSVLTKIANDEKSYFLGYFLKRHMQVSIMITREKLADDIQKECIAILKERGIEMKYTSYEPLPPNTIRVTTSFSL
jgi:hypothetical protein